MLRRDDIVALYLNSVEIAVRGYQLHRGWEIILHKTLHLLHLVRLALHCLEDSSNDILQPGDLPGYRHSRNRIVGFPQNS